MVTAELCLGIELPMFLPLLVILRLILLPRSVEHEIGDLTGSAFTGTDCDVFLAASWSDCFGTGIPK